MVAGMNKDSDPPPLDSFKVDGPPIPFNDEYPRLPLLPCMLCEERGFRVIMRRIRDLSEDDSGEGPITLTKMVAPSVFPYLPRQFFYDGHFWDVIGATVFPTRAETFILLESDNWEKCEGEEQVSEYLNGPGASPEDIKVYRLGERVKVRSRFSLDT